MGLATTEEGPKGSKGPAADTDRKVDNQAEAFSRFHFQNHKKCLFKGPLVSKKV